VLDLVDEATAEARAVGAVNTIAWNQGQLCGHNTDVFGLLESLRRDGGMEQLPACAALLGAGGAARAALYALLQQPEVERVVLLNRTPERAELLAADLDRRNVVTVARLDTDGCALVRQAGLLINATTVGMFPHGDASPLADPGCLHGDMLVLDTVYNPSPSVLLKQVEAAGARGINGLGRLAYQGARSFQIWTDCWPPVQVMLDALRVRLAAR
jgi:shikimate dehydrogenase